MHCYHTNGNNVNHDQWFIWLKQVNGSKYDIIFIMYCRSSGSKPFLVEACDLIKIGYKFQSALREFWIESMEAFIDVTNFGEAFGLVESVLL